MKLGVAKTTSLPTSNTVGIISNSHSFRKFSLLKLGSIFAISVKVCACSDCEKTSASRKNKICINIILKNIPCVSTEVHIQKYCSHFKEGRLNLNILCVSERGTHLQVLFPFKKGKT